MKDSSAKNANTRRSTSALNRDAILDRLSGDVSILKKVVKLFEEDCPEQMAEIQRAIDVQDGKALAASAHTLKGSLLVLAADRAANTAQQLETLGRDYRFDEAGEVFTTLESEISRLSAALQEMVKDLA
jgi:HPt (histidine-containing phosphotransfer) domain-containing protein